MPNRLQLLIRIRAEHGGPVRGTVVEQRGGAVRYFGNLRDLHDLLALRSHCGSTKTHEGRAERQPSEPQP